MDLGVSEHKMYTHTSTYILSIHDSACLLVRVCVPSLSFSESRWRWAVAVAASLSSSFLPSHRGRNGRNTAFARLCPSPRLSLFPRLCHTILHYPPSTPACYPVVTLGPENAREDPLQAGASGVLAGRCNGQVQGRSTAQTRGGVRVPAEARDSLTDTHSVPYTRAVSVLIQESNTLARYEHPSRAAIMLLWPQDHSIVLPFHHIVLILSQEAVLGSCWQPRAFSPRKRASGCKCHSFAYCVAR